ncbi:MAG: 10 kDa chaperonin [candidate division CPR1 bacterium GW2011_GWA2_42_17]|uniref:Co-chaperonin GroES n=1 Tax=candidate division CPR1 bacterium GW2011_GWA2_42_17 TaxID=1618341 RepID=A0A0G0Z6G6_9BACT|nr:MAG: 10 kDa chaperonin [candidate division CPR1 bacterium GW2011_GWA2_42_17]
MAKKNKKSLSESSLSKIGIKPLGDRVLIKEIKAVEGGKTASGIFIPDTVKEDRGAKQGEVVAVGPGRMDDGKLIPISVKVGDQVLYQWGDTIKIGETEYVMVSESNIIGIIK